MAMASADVSSKAPVRRHRLPHTPWRPLMGLTESELQQPPTELHKDQEIDDDLSLANVRAPLSTDGDFRSAAVNPPRHICGGANQISAEDEVDLIDLKAPVPSDEEEDNGERKQILQIWFLMYKLCNLQMTRLTIQLQQRLILRPLLLKNQLQESLPLLNSLSMPMRTACIPSRLPIR